MNPPLTLEISAFEPPSPLEFPVTFRGGRGYGYFLEPHIINRPPPYGDHQFIKWTRLFFFASVGLTYEQSAVKLVVRVLKNGAVLYKTYAHISLLNVTFVCSCLLIYSI